MAPSKRLRPYEEPEHTVSGDIETVELLLSLVDKDYPVQANRPIEARVNKAIRTLEAVCNFRQNLQDQQQQGGQEDGQKDGQDDRQESQHKGQLSVSAMITLAQLRELLINYCLVSRVLCALKAEELGAWDARRIQERRHNAARPAGCSISRAYEQDAERAAARVLAMFWGARESDFQLAEPGEPANVTERRGWDDPVQAKLTRLAARLGQRPSHVRALFWRVRAPWPDYFRRRVLRRIYKAHFATYKDYSF